MTPAIERWNLTANRTNHLISKEKRLRPSQSNEAMSAIHPPTRSILLLIAPSYSDCLFWTSCPIMGDSSVLFLFIRSGRYIRDHRMRLSLPTLTYEGELATSTSSSLLSISLPAGFISWLALIAAPLPSPCSSLVVLCALSSFSAFRLALGAVCLLVLLVCRSRSSGFSRCGVLRCRRRVLGSVRALGGAVDPVSGVLRAFTSLLSCSPIYIYASLTYPYSIGWKGFQ